MNTTSACTRPSEAIRVVLTGADGMLGSDIVSVFQQNSSYSLIPLTRKDLDITRKADVDAVLSSLRPKLIVHAAAYTQVDQAETDRQACYDVNVLGTRYVAEAAQDLGASVCYFSTDYVFDGSLGRPYREEDAVNPLNVYGKSKWEGEEAVRKACAQHWIVRISWLYGHHGRHFIGAILNKARQGEDLTVVSDQLGCPTWTRSLAERLPLLLKEGAWGTYHLCSSGQCSWFELAHCVVEQMDLGVAVRPVTSEAFPRPAKRSAYSVLDNSKANALLGDNPMPFWQDDVIHFLQSEGV